MNDRLEQTPPCFDYLAPLPIQVPAILHLGGFAKTAPEDFVVEELPAYEPCGSGDHLFLWLEKVAMPASSLLGHLSRSLKVKPREIGCAGLKYTQALTRQYISVPASAVDCLEALGSDSRVRLLGHRLHTNKLRTGHLKGNRFRIRLVQCLPEAAARLPALREFLLAWGIPNYFGGQRFGRGGSTLTMGLRLLQGQAEDGRAAGGSAGRSDAPRSLHRLALSSV